MTGFTDVYAMTILFLSITGIMYGAVVFTYDDHQPDTEIESVTTQPSNHADNSTQYNTNITNPGTTEITETIELQNETGDTLDSHTETIPPNTTHTTTLNASETQLQNTTTTHVTTPTQNYATPPTQTSSHIHNDTNIQGNTTQFEVENVEKQVKQGPYQNSQLFTTTIRNTGSYAETEPVQLTTRNTRNGTRDVIEEKELHLEPNQTKTISLEDNTPDNSNQLRAIETPTHSKPYHEPTCNADSDALQVGIEETLGSFFGFSDEDHTTC